MNTLVAIALSTPVWGFALQPPMVAPSIAPEHVVQLRAIEAMEEALAEQDELEAEARNLSTMEWTRSLSLATITAFAFGAGIGFVQFADEYGFHGAYQETACATGDAVLDYCGEATPWAHLGAIGATAGLGLTTFVLSTQVDYERAARVDADWRIYEITRWVGLAMFLVQAAGGALLANALRFGWADEQRDFETLQALAAAHMAWGAATLGMEVYNTAILF